jgi:hypothetical protein
MPKRSRSSGGGVGSGAGSSESARRARSTGGRDGRGEGDVGSMSAEDFAESAYLLAMGKGKKAAGGQSRKRDEQEARGGAGGGHSDSDSNAGSPPGNRTATQDRHLLVSGKGKKAAGGQSRKRVVQEARGGEGGGHSDSDSNAGSLPGNGTATQDRLYTSDSSDAGSPRRVYVPVRSSAPTPVASAQKVKANPAQVAAARERAMELCTTPEEFVQKIVYEGVSAEHVQFATQLPDTWSNLVANNRLLDLIRARRQLADASIAFWRKMFPVALPIAVSMVGIKHTTLGQDNYGVNPADKRSFWFMCFVLAALNQEAMGPGRPHHFILTVWELTMRNFMVPCQERDGRSGGRKRVSTTHGILALSVPV